MVTEKIIYSYRCDRCGREITGSVFSPIWGKLDQDGDGNYNRDGDIIPLDICAECKDETEKLICSLYKKKTKEKTTKNDKNREEVDEKPRKGRRSKLDDGKMMALRRAGWSHQQIAEEFGVTSWTVGHHLRKIEANKAIIGEPQETEKEGTNED